MRHVLRLLSAAALLAAIVAGCGGGAPPQRSALRGVPPALAQDWEGQASAIAAAASAGNSCLALHLAAALRTDVARSRHKLPYRLRSPLLTGVNALADRITCTPVVTQPAPPKKPPKGPQPKPKPPKHHGPHGDHKGHDR
jgi:hypothetical protein